MPSTFTGLILFALLVTPGAAYVAVRQRRIPRRDRSIFGEMVTVVVASFVACTIAAFGGWTVSQAIPEHALDPATLISKPQQYIAANLTQFSLWLWAFVVAATIVAFVGGLIANKFRKIHPSSHSAWGVLFDRDSSWVTGKQPSRKDAADNRNETVHISCLLDDGTWITGYYGTANTRSEEIVDRDLVLQAPIKCRFPNETETTLFPSSAVCISARRITSMFVSYIDPAAPPIIEPSDPQAKAQDPAAAAQAPEPVAQEREEAA